VRNVARTWSTSVAREVAEPAGESRTVITMSFYGCVEKV